MHSGGESMLVVHHSIFNRFTSKVIGHISLVNGYYH